MRRRSRRHPQIARLVQRTLCGGSRWLERGVEHRFHDAKTVRTDDNATDLGDVGRAAMLTTEPAARRVKGRLARRELLRGTIETVTAEVDPRTGYNTEPLTEPLSARTTSNRARGTREKSHHCGTREA